MLRGEGAADTYGNVGLNLLGGQPKYLDNYESNLTAATNKILGRIKFEARELLIKTGIKRNKSPWYALD